jgi:tetratricopeptide (TPR) repeat protein
VRGPAADAALAHAGGWLHVADPKVDRTASAVRRSRWARALVDYQRVMAWLPGSAAAERASFERAATYGDLGLPERVRDEARAIVARFPESDRLDEALAAEAQASFALGNYAEAAPPATRLRNELFPPKGDKKAKSAFAESAAYLLGRIAHVEGRLQDAVALYGEAAPRVPEAGQAYAFFTRKLLATDAVVRVRPGGAAEIPVRVMNVAKASVALYPVDLGVLFATRKSFDALNRADLSGIAPTLAFDFETGVAPYVEGTARIAIEGGLKTGAYLAVVGDGERTATAVVLSSDLDVHVQRGDGDLVRCYVVDVNGKPAAGAKIATGRGGSVRLGGVADERGMLHVDVPGSGKITVVAELGDRYAAAEL